MRHFTNLDTSSSCRPAWVEVVGSENVGPAEADRSALCCRSKQGSDFARMAASLEARFSGRERGGRRREREPTEEEFAAAAAKLKQQKQDSVKAAKEKAAKPSKTVVGKRKKAQRGIASSTKMQQRDS